MSTQALISVIVCTRNRGRQLAGTLESLGRQDYAGPWELVVVDNGSTDDTPAVLEAFGQDCPFELRVVREPVAGLSRARNRGLANARGEIVAYTDDDCYPREDYLTAITRRFGEDAIDFGGGRVLLFDPSDQRVTIQERDTPATLEPGTFIQSGLIHGANMIARRSALLDLQGFDERLGAGTAFKSGEDTDMLRRLVLSGRRGAYDPRIVVFHHHGRKTVEAAQALERGYRCGFGSCMLKYTLNPSTRSEYARMWYWRLRKTDLGDIARELLAAAQFYVKYGPGWKRVWAHPHEGLDP